MLLSSSTISVYSVNFLIGAPKPPCEFAVDLGAQELGKGLFLDNIAIPAQGSDSVCAKCLLRRLVQSDFSWGLVPRSDSELFQGAPLAELRFSQRVLGVFSDSDVLKSCERPMPLLKTQCKRPMPLLHQPMYY